MFGAKARAQHSLFSQQRQSQGSQHSLEGNAAPQREKPSSEPCSSAGCIGKCGIYLPKYRCLMLLRDLGAFRGFSLAPQPPKEQLREAESLQSHHTGVVNGLTVWETLS